MDEIAKQFLQDALLEQLPIGVILTDPNGEMVFVNSAAERIRKVQRDALIGRNVLQCHRQSSRDNVSRALDNILKKPKNVYRRMVEDQKNEQYYLNTYAGIADAQGNALGMAVLTEDITEKRKLELERSKTYQMMQETANNLRIQYHDLLTASLETIATILEKRDPYTCNHSNHVCACSLKLYEYRYGVGSDYVTLKTAALLHDIGKIGIPDAILHKPGKLTPDEVRVIRLHAVIAEDILKPLDSGTAISGIVRHHHERFDGSGYPDGLAGSTIPLASRIIAVADTYDAMRSDRPYRAAVPMENCLKEIRAAAGTQLDPEWVEIFLELADTGSL